jgi:DNA mismatch endonuclease (patch repair protein)
MSKIKYKDTKLEVIVRKYLFSKGFRFRKNVKWLAGKPDIVLPKYKTVIFVHGCFWHGHPDCPKSKLPETRMDFWKKKIESNILNDKKNIALLQSYGWQTIVVWQCEINNKIKRNNRLEKLMEEILSGNKCYK